MLHSTYNLTLNWHFVYLDNDNKAPVVDLSVYREWKDKFILERSKRNAEQKSDGCAKPKLFRTKTMDNRDTNELDQGVLWG